MKLTKEEKALIVAKRAKEEVLLAAKLAKEEEGQEMLAFQPRPLESYTPEEKIAWFDAHFNGFI